MDSLQRHTLKQIPLWGLTQLRFAAAWFSGCLTSTASPEHMKEGWFLQPRVLTKILYKVSEPCHVTQRGEKQKKKTNRPRNLLLVVDKMHMQRQFLGLKCMLLFKNKLLLPVTTCLFLWLKEFLLILSREPRAKVLAKNAVSGRLALQQMQTLSLQDHRIRTRSPTTRRDRIAAFTRHRVLYYTNTLAHCHLKYKRFAKNTSGLIPLQPQAPYITVAELSDRKGTLTTLLPPCLERKNLVLATEGV